MIKKLQHKYALSPKGAKDMIKACVLCAVNNILQMLPVGILFLLVQDLMAGGVDKGKIGLYIAGCVVCLAVLGIGMFFQYNACFFSTYEESGVRRIALAEKLRKLPLSYFGKKDLSDLTSTIMADCATMETASSHWIPELFGSFISTVAIAVLLFFYDWRMALAALWVLPVAFAVIFSASGLLHKLQLKQMDSKMACADGIQECLEAVRDLHANNAESAYLAGLDKKIKNVERSTIRTELCATIFNSSARMILKLGIATTALAGGILLTKGQLPVLTLLAYLLVISRLYDPMIGALDNFSAVLSTKVQCDRLDEILSGDTQTGSCALTNQGCDIVFDHVDFAYNNKEQVLRDVSFTAKQGQVTALVGPSGGGKTTVSRLAARFWDATKGTITVGGMNVAETDPEALMSLYSIVFQDVTLFNNTVMENIRLGRKDATDAEVLAAAKLANCDAFAVNLPQGYNTTIGENGCELSGGERQRISIARAFLKDAPIILLDEATASLDVENESQIQAALSRLIADKTVLVIAHRMRTVAGADQVVVLADGTVAESGTPAELLQKDGIFRHMAQLQSQGQAWTF